MNHLYDETIRLLKNLIATPSFSREEADTADLIQKFLKDRNISARRHKNNVWATNEHFAPDKPTLLLNSHHDTVKPGAGYTKDPFAPVVEDQKLFGLGANDAGGALTSLIAAFVHFYSQKDLNYNLVLAATAEEEICGDNGIVSILNIIPDIDCAMVGEPTQMRMAVAEKGLIVLDCTARGSSGHAARDEGENAIYKAVKDMEWFRTYKFEKVSEFLGPVKMTATVVNAGSQHNVVPDSCTFTVDVRTTDAYSNRDTLQIIKNHTQSEVKPRSVRLNPSFISLNHPLVRGGLALDLQAYGSPTLSDQALLKVPSLKMGPGKSARSHTDDEYIYLHEIEEGIKIYINLLNKIL